MTGFVGRLAALPGIFAIVAACGSPVQAQNVDCRFFKVVAESVNVFTEPRGDATFLRRLNKNDFVCVLGSQQVGDHSWAFVAYQVLGQNQRNLMDGWGIMTALEPAAPAELAALRNSPAPQVAKVNPQEPTAPSAPAPPPGQPTPASPAASLAPPPQTARSVTLPPAAPPPAQPPPNAASNVAAPPPAAPAPAQPPPSAASNVGAPPPPPSSPAAVLPTAPPAAPLGQDVIRFSDPITDPSSPLNGRSLEQLIAGVPLFPPFDGLPDDIWRKTCSNCHQWNRQSLCVQAKIYAQAAKMAYRKQHPYGGPEKIQMMEWAQSGCQ